jgi:hypothetical protein
MIRRGIAVLLGLTMLSASGVSGAWAADWFKGPVCFDDGCMPGKECSSAKESPAQVYEKFKLIGSEIVDKTDGRVDVIFASQGVRLHETFFRDAESCQRFNNELVRAQEQERQREQDKLSKYR